VIVEGIEDPPGAAAGHPEDVIDAGLFEDPDDGPGDGNVMIEQSLHRHRATSRMDFF
jgi:hypothetical protein